MIIISIFTSLFSRSNLITTNFELSNKFMLISQDENNNIYKIWIDRSEKTLIKKKMEKSEIIENSMLKNIILNQKPDIFSEKLPQLEMYEAELKKLEEKSTFFKEDYRSKISYYYFTYQYINYTQCFYYEKTLDHELFAMFDSLLDATFPNKSEGSLFYEGKNIEFIEHDSNTKSLKIGSNNFIVLMNNNDTMDSDFKVPPSECIYYNLTSQTPENKYNIQLDQKVQDEIYSHYKTNFLSQYESLLITPPKFGFSFDFKFCGNWCGPEYGGLNDEKCKDVCSKNLDKPSEECRTCRPPVNEVDEICMLHDFCCAKTQIINQNICGHDFNSYDCDCHISMVGKLKNIKWHFGECNFVEKVMMEILFKFLGCRCKYDQNFQSLYKNESFHSALDSCVPAFMCNL